MLTQQLFPALKPFEHIATNLGKNWVNNNSTLVTSRASFIFLSANAEQTKN